MSLTMGIGPLGRGARTHLNVDLSDAPRNLVYLHPVEKRIRGVLNGETVVDTRRAKLLHETGLLPQWYVPMDDVKPGVLEPTDTTTHCPYKGDASYWTVRVGDRVETDAVWGYPEPLPAVPDLKGMVAVYYDRLDMWFEEDEPLLGHPRDPFHRVDTRRTSRPVTVRVGGVEVAKTERAVALFETGLRVRYYIPRPDVRTDLLAPSEKQTVCPYKGVASYHHLRVDGNQIDDGAWYYPHPLAEAVAATDHLSFDGEGIEVVAGD